ncbi:MAG TPA: patatin-like phospholipase family protein [Clostridiales bacterium]|nr:patatin-like phospholipase family protein [Clostridiales bacterium]
MFGLALSGGGTKGFAHIGVLKALHKHGLKPARISGASAGAIVAGLYAMGYSPQDLEHLAYSQYKNLIDPNYYGIVKGIVQFAMGKEVTLDGIIKGDKIENLLSSLTRGLYMYEVDIPLAITAVDINNGKTVIFINNKNRVKKKRNIEYRDNVTLAQAMRASIAIPVIFSPQIVSGMRLVDGGLTDNLPVHILKQMGAYKVLGIYLGYSGEARCEVDNIFEIASQSLDIMAYNITRLKSIGADYILRPNVYDIDSTPLSPQKIGEYIKRGYSAVDNNIDMIKKVLK